jgi:hypothetical protein
MVGPMAERGFEDEPKSNYEHGPGGRTQDAERREKQAAGEQGDHRYAKQETSENLVGLPLPKRLEERRQIQPHASTNHRHHAIPSETNDLLDE